MASAQSSGEDLAAVEARINARLQNVTMELSRTQAAVENLSLAESQNQARLLVLLDVLQDAVGAMQQKVNASDSTVHHLAGNYTDLRARLDALALAVQSGRNESFEDNLQIYNALVGTDKAPILPAFDDEVQRIVEAQFKLRSDLDALNSNVTEGFNSINHGNEAIFGVAGKSQSSDRWQLIALLFVVVSQVVTLSIATKRPRRLWRRLQYEAERTEKRGVFVNPPCPREGEGLHFGQAFQCPHAGTCPVGQECKTFAIQQVTAEAKTPDLPEPAAQPAPPAGDPLAGFGGDARA